MRNDQHGRGDGDADGDMVMPSRGSERCTDSPPKTTSGRVTARQSCQSTSLPRLHRSSSISLLIITFGLLIITVALNEQTTMSSTTGPASDRVCGSAQCVRVARTEMGFYSETEVRPNAA